MIEFFFLVLNVVAEQILRLLKGDASALPLVDQATDADRPVPEVVLVGMLDEVLFFEE